MAQLDEVVRAAETQVEERQVQLNQLTVTRAEVSQNLQHNELNETLKKVSDELNEKIQRLEASGDRIPSVWLGWMDEWLESGIAGLCHVCQGVSYVNRHNPVWSGVNEGKGNMKIFSPFDLSIDGENGDIFVCDHGADRIQVFSKEGNYSRTIEPPGMSRPSFIAVSPGIPTFRYTTIRYTTFRYRHFVTRHFVTATFRYTTVCYTTLRY